MQDEGGLLKPPLADVEEEQAKSLMMGNAVVEMNIPGWISPSWLASEIINVADLDTQRT